jgi:hypothetical protein
MTLRRIILLILLLPAAGVIVWYFKLPGEGHEILCYVFAVPVLVLNMWEWTSPEILDGLFEKEKAAGDSAAGMRSKGGAAAGKKKSKPIPASLVLNRALSIRQPHAEKILRGIKTIEYRAAPTNNRGRVYIYASTRPAELDVFEELGAKPGDFPTGVLVGTVEIVGCEKPVSSEKYQWQLANPQRLAEPLKPDNKPQPVWFIPFRIKPPGN